MSFTTDQSATVHTVLRYEFHGILYFELRYTLPEDAPGTVRGERLAAHQIYSDPQAGDRIVIHRLMGMIHQVSKAPGK